LGIWGGKKGTRGFPPPQNGDRLLEKNFYYSNEGGGGNCVLRRRYQPRKKGPSTVNRNWVKSRIDQISGEKGSLQRNKIKKNSTQRHLRRGGVPRKKEGQKNGGDRKVVSFTASTKGGEKTATFGFKETSGGKNKREQNNGRGVKGG